MQIKKSINKKDDPGQHLHGTTNHEIATRLYAHATRHNISRPSHGWNKALSDGNFPQPKNNHGQVRLDDPLAADTTYGCAFVAMDLTRHRVHAFRLRAIALLQSAHEQERLLHPHGPALLYEEPRAHSSHITVVRGIPAARLPRKKQKEEQPTVGQLDAFLALQAHRAPRLMLGSEVIYWEGPAQGPKRYRVAALEIIDPDDALTQMRETFSAKGGKHRPPVQKMHLTLALLNLARKSLPAEVAKGIKQLIEGERGHPPEWRQSSLTYIGRYHFTDKKPIAEIKLLT